MTKTIGQAAALAAALALYGFAATSWGLHHEEHEEPGAAAEHVTAAVHAGTARAEEAGGENDGDELFGLPLHPMVVHFPVALFLSALLFALAGLGLRNEGLERSAVTIFIFAALITPLVARTGMMEAHELNLHHPLLERHEDMGLWALWTALGALPLMWVARGISRNLFRAFFLVALVSVAVFVSLGAHYGGTMVYEYGVGIENH